MRKGIKGGLAMVFGLLGMMQTTRASVEGQEAPKGGGEYFKPNYGQGAMYIPTRSQRIKRKRLCVANKKQGRN